MDDDATNPPTSIGDSFSGQRQFELRSTQHRSVQTHGNKAGKSVALMNASDARRLVSKALGSDDDVVFQWDPHHEKTGVSGIRFNYYRDRVKCTADYFRERKVKIPGTGKKNAIIRNDLVHDVQRGILTFLFPEMTEPEQREEVLHDVCYVAVEDEDVTYRALTLKPNLPDPETDIMYQLYSKSMDQELTALQLELISTIQKRPILPCETRLFLF